MSRVLALSADLLFGSRVQAALTLAGHHVELIADETRLRQRLSEPAGEPVELLVVDLTDAQLDGTGVVGSLTQEGRLEQVRTLGFYSHVDTAARQRAEQAGFDLVVARSRMAREAAQLVSALAQASRPVGHGDREAR
jgi:DNA-binding response OmpR family regulator